MASGTLDPADTRALARLIDQRHECLSQLAELGRRQVEYVQAQEMTHLLTVLSGKQRLIDALNGIERLLDPFRTQDPAARRWTSAGERQRCAQLAADCERLLAEIVEQERTSESVMCVRQHEISERLRTAQASVAARGAYSAAGAVSVRQLDLSSGT